MEGNGDYFAPRGGEFRMSDANAHDMPSVPNSSATNPPHLPVPAETCDCHMHVYGDRFPTVSYPHLWSGNAGVCSCFR